MQEYVHHKIVILPLSEINGKKVRYLMQDSQADLQVYFSWIIDQMVYQDKLIHRLN